jgi:hypothetical protein
LGIHFRAATTKMLLDDVVRGSFPSFCQVGTSNAGACRGDMSKNAG